jgi:hypothetical protein
MGQRSCNAWSSLGRETSQSTLRLLLDRLKKESTNICATHNVCASGLSVGSICAYGKGPAPTNAVWGRSPIGDVPFGLGHHSSVNGRVAGPALRAVDEEAMHLIVLGVQQDRPAVAA